MGRVLRRVARAIILLQMATVCWLTTGPMVSSAADPLVSAVAHPSLTALGAKEFVRKGVPQGIFAPDGG